MGRGALLTGTAGGIIGVIASAIGIIWFFSSLLMGTNVSYLPVLFDGMVMPIPYYAGPSGFQIGITILFVVLLAVSLILTGVGFYGEYTVGQSSMGVVGLVFGIIGGIATTLILVGLFVSGGSIFGYSGINIIWDWIALAILGLSFILMGSASIVVRESSTHSGAAVAAGILSIIGAVCLIIYVLSFIGFALLFVAFLLWAIVFYGTEA